jgi:hypothetical protein
MAVIDDPPLLRFTGFDAAILGHWYDPDGGALRIAYSGRRILLILQEDMPEEDAQEWVSYNMESAYVGPSTPIIVWEDDESWG